VPFARGAETAALGSLSEPRAANTILPFAWTVTAWADRSGLVSNRVGHGCGARQGLQDSHTCQARRCQNCLCRGQRL